MPFRNSITTILKLEKKFENSTIAWKLEVVIYKKKYFVW